MKKANWILCVPLFFCLTNSCLRSYCGTQITHETIVDSLVVKKIMTNTHCIIKWSGFMPCEGSSIDTIAFGRGMGNYHVDWFQCKSQKGVNDRNYSDLEINYKFFSDTGGAMLDFNQMTESIISWAGKSNLYFFWNSQKQICFSRVIEAQSGAEGGCYPMGYYYSCIYIRDGKVLIGIQERTSNKESTRLNTILQSIVGEK